MSRKVLFVTSEVHPLIKTGGLGDVSASLPSALRDLGDDVRLVLPAYQKVLAQFSDLETLAVLELPSAPGTVRVLDARMPDSGVHLWLIDAPESFNRAGGPYVGPDGQDWADNAQRFTVFARAAVELAMDRAGLDWRPDVVHCNDWQSGLVPALLSLERKRPGTVFTIHNLAYQGLFPWEQFARLGLPQEWWSLDALEFHGQCSFIKGGLVFADRLTTVSPTYAAEIRTPEFGYGLDGLLTWRADRLDGILNGADYGIWDPQVDGLIARNYGADDLSGKAANKQALQRRFNLPEDPEVPLIGMVGRMVEQKGVDLVVGALPELLRRGVQLVVLGSGDPDYETAFCELARRNPRQLGMHIGYCEERAHLVEAGADMFLMPSRFEPCGLNQIYSLRYGTVPIVRRTGGLADTVVDASPGTASEATGFAFSEATPEALAKAISRALTYFKSPVKWRQLQVRGMARDFSWTASARRYHEVYDKAVQNARR